MKTTSIMKKSAVFLTALTLAFSAMSFIFILSNNEVNSLEVGDDAPLTEYKMKDVSGEMLSINDVKKENGVLVVFSCNTCPFVVGNDKWTGWQGRYNAIQEKCDELGVGMVLVNSNEAKRAKGDSFEDNKAQVAKEGFTSRYVIDKDHQLADAFGARTTPHVYLLNNKLQLVYRGAIDDSAEDPEQVEEEYLFNALNNLAAGKAIDPSLTKAIGCSIKRK